MADFEDAQPRDRRGQRAQAAGRDLALRGPEPSLPAADCGGAGAVGKRTLTEVWPPGNDVQRKATNNTDASQVHASAQRGIATPASPLPHADRLQRLFGRHDISKIQAHTGDAAAAS